MRTIFMIVKINGNNDDAGPVAIRRLCRNQSGATIIEFAIILPVLVLLIFGIIEFSLILYDNAMLANASREGARAAVIYQYPARTSCGDIEITVDNYCKEHLVSFGDSGYNIKVNNKDIQECMDDGDPPPCLQSFPVTIRVEYDYEFLFFPFGGINLDAQTTMRCE